MHLTNQPHILPTILARARLTDLRTHAILNVLRLADLRIEKYVLPSAQIHRTFQITFGRI
jgi:hypothetical protein